MSATLTRNGKAKVVKNLGWLRSNWQSVKSFKIEEPAEGAKFGHLDCIMIATLDHGDTYQTGWADRSLIKPWLARPVFKGVPLDYFGEITECGVAPLDIPKTIELLASLLGEKPEDIRISQAPNTAFIVRVRGEVQIESFTLERAIELASSDGEEYISGN